MTNVIPMNTTDNPQACAIEDDSGFTDELEIVWKTLNQANTVKNHHALQSLLAMAVIYWRVVKQDDAAMEDLECIASTATVWAAELVEQSEPINNAEVIQFPSPPSDTVH